MRLLVLFAIIALAFLGCVERQPVIDRGAGIPQSRYGILTDNLWVEDRVVGSGARLPSLLEGFQLTRNQWSFLNGLSRDYFDFKKITVGRRHCILADPTTCKVRNWIVETSLTDFTVFHFGDTLRVESCTKETEIREKRVSGKITHSLYKTVKELGVSDELTNKVVDILGWQIDFFRLQSGDELRIIYDEILLDGKAIAVDQILGIAFEQGGRIIYAIPFDEGAGPEYFDADGNSLRKAFLKYPIEFTKIGSRYSKARFHPVLKVVRPHLGTDLSAPLGTPIRAVGDGQVEEAGFREGNGNYVKLHHNGTYSTGYLHMSRIAEGIRPGRFVRQGDIIGFVGSTGWSTGPHLCYRFWKNGTQIDALTVDLPPSKPVSLASKGRFEFIRNEKLRCLTEIRSN
ncbi:MAG: peptidoglycan DD-metalloendopeptidase family protein [Cyclobacteriaceae bacterium]|nr:peptidoglycan DD-metalloendopeptidase family protein [Cyclobacteriaceae bacterium]